MPPYFAHDCVTYYSPSFGIFQLLTAFSTGIILTAVCYELLIRFEKYNAPLPNANVPLEQHEQHEHEHEQHEPNQNDLNRLQAQIQTLEGQRARASHVIVGLLVVSWLFLVGFALKNNSGINPKTEL